MAAVTGTLLAAALLTLGAGVAYLAAGVSFARQAKAKGLPLALFSLFWFALGFYGLTDGAWSLAVPLLDPPLAVGVTILLLKTLVECVGFYGLVSYLLYVYTGEEKLLVPLAGFYVVVYLVVLYGYLAAQPIGQQVHPWRSGLVYAHKGTFLDTLGVLALFVPPLLASIAYARLVPKAADPRQRMRALTVSLSLAAFFGGLLIGWTVGSAWYWWPLIEKVLALGTGWMVVGAMLAERR